MNPVLAFLAFAAAAIPADGAPEPAPQAVPFTTHSGYFVSNKFEPQALSSFVLLEDRKAFDSVFGTAMVQANKAHRLPPEAFEKSVVVAAIHRGRAMVSYSVDSVTVEGTALVVRYTTKSEPSATAEFACPLLLSVPKAGYAAVSFIENGKEIRKLERPSAAAFQIDSKEQGTVTAAAENGKQILVIKGGKGIGRAAIRSTAGTWPQELVIRVHLGGLEQFVISRGTVKLTASVLSHSGHQALLHLWKDGKEGPPLDKTSPFWMEIRRLDASGKPAAGLPPKGGWFEMTVPKALLPESGPLELEWIDFYR